MTRLLVLGGGRHQVPLIQHAEARGVEVVLVDYLTDAPGRSIASHSELADATDPDAAIRLAKEYEVDGVTTTGTDIPIRAMAAVGEALDLPCYLTADAAHKATNKEAMYAALSAAGVPMTTRTIVTEKEGVGSRDMPVVVKPADSQGQRGVTLVRPGEDFSRAISDAQSSSRSGRVLIEQYLPGPEFTANTWIHEGEVVLLMVNDRVTFNPSPYLGIAFQHRYPSQAAAPWREQVHLITQRVARAYGMEQGPLYIQMIATDRGPVVVEAAARVGGGHESRLLLYLNRWSTDAALVGIALGESPPIPPPLPTDAHALVNFILGRSGTVERVVDPELVEGVVEASWYVQPGARLTEVVNSLGRVGYFIAAAGAREELVDRAAEFYSDLELPSSEGHNLVHVPDPTMLNLPR